MSAARIIELTTGDADEIVALEQRSFIPPLQATRRTVLERFRLGHHMLGLREGDRLVGMISFSYGNFSPTDFGAFPKSLKELCLQPVPRAYNSVFAYNLEVEPSRRGGVYVKMLVDEGTAVSVRDGCHFAVSNCRLPSYNGSEPRFGQEQVERNPKFRGAIDRFLAGGRFPTQDEFRLDPLLALYHRLTACTYLWILPNFAPDDVASGGIRVIGYAEIAKPLATRRAEFQDLPPNTSAL